MKLVETAIKEDGFIDIESLNTVCVSSLDSYHTTNNLNRFKYAKPHLAPQVLEMNSTNNLKGT